MSYYAEYQKAFRKTEHYKQYRNAYQQTDSYKKYQKEYKASGRLQQKRLERHKQIKKEAFQLLGSKCKYCGNEDMRCLQIDHIEPVYNGHSTLHGLFLCRQILRTGDITNLQLLCANCHAIKSHEEAWLYGKKGRKGSVPSYFTDPIP